MRNKLYLLFAFLICIVSNASGQQSVVSKTIDELADHKYSKVYSRFSKKVKKGFNKRMLRKTWKTYEEEYGKFVKTTSSNVQRENGITKTTSVLQFEKSSLNLLIVTGEKGKIIGIGFPPSAYAFPDWAVNKVYGKERILVVSDTFKMKGELMLPNDCNQCPVAILLQGSGGSDMDGSSTTGPNKMYLDLALGLANHGIASIRFDKRTFVYGKNSTVDSTMTLEEEYITDALSAVKLAKTFSFLDTNQIFIIGHSLGAYAAPFIAKRDSNIAGIAMLAGPIRPLYEVIPEQYTFLFGLDGKISKREQAILDLTHEEVKFIKNEESKVDELKILGKGSAMESYLRSFIGLSPADTIKDLNCKVLILQGDRDYQVRYETEYNAYKAELEDLEHVQLNLMPGLNHFLMFGTEPSTPYEYTEPNHVDEAVFDIIDEWVQKK